MKLMFGTIYQIARSVRPRQWLKNTAVLAVPFFSGVLFDLDIIWLGIQAFVVFSATSSAVYLLNDIVDAPKDRLHPVKKNRPIASGKLSPKLAGVVSFVLFVGSLAYAWSFLGTYFTVVIAAYILLQLGYSFFFRNVIILDALIVATGFILRVFAGGFATDTSVSSWLILTTIGLSLLMAFGKRRSEKTLLAEKIKEVKAGTRATLKHYPDSLLDSIISMSASFCLLSYSLFTFQTSEAAQAKTVFSSVLPSILRTPKFMMLTIPLVIYGIARYLYVIYEKKAGESPARILLSDKPLLGTVVLWGLSIFVIVYVLQGGLLVS